MTYRKWIDVAKGIGILLVILVHSNFNPLAVAVISTFNMPLFFFLSGYVYHYSKYKQDPNQFISQKLKRLVIPYFITNIIIFSTYILLSYLNVYSLNGTPPVNYLVGIIYGNGAPLNPPTMFTNILSIPSWFLLSLFCAFLLLYILAGIHEKFGLKISGVFVILFFVFGYKISKYLLLPWGFDIACVSMVFMFSAYLISQYQGKISYYKELLSSIPFERIKTFLYYCFIIAILWAIISINGRVDMNTRNYANPLIFCIGGLLGTFIIIGFSRRVSQKDGVLTKSLVFLGKNSLVILLYHSFTSVLLILILGLFVNAKEVIYNSPILSIFNMLLTSIVVILFMKKLPLFEKIYFT